MAKRTMSGSEMLAHSRNRHEQKSLKERLEELSHSEFLVRDTSRVEAHRWRQFLRENHRSTGWSPMAMKPDIFSEGDGACVDSNEQSGSTPRRRYDLQAIKKYQRPWACTLKTGDSYNKVYRELAEAGESSQKALYTPRQATLALMGVASFAKGRTFNKHPRLAQTVPAVVGMERARSAWLPGPRSQLLQENDNGKLLKARLTLRSAPASQELQQSETITQLDPQIRAKLESQNPSLKLVKKATSAWLANDKLNRDSVSDATLNKACASSKVKFQQLSKMGQSVMDLNRLRKSVDSWKCCMCGGDRRPLSHISDNDNGKDEETCKSNFYDASVALRGLQRAKTVLDGILYKDDLKSTSLESKNTPSECKNPSKERSCCSCEHSKAVNDKKLKEFSLGRSEQKQQRKPPKKKPQGSVDSKSQKNQAEAQENVLTGTKNATITRKKGVIGRPQGLFDNMNIISSIEVDKPSPACKEVKMSCQKKISTEKEPSSAIHSLVKGNDFRQDKTESFKTICEENCKPLQTSSGVQTDSNIEKKTGDIQDEYNYERPKEFKISANSKTFRHVYSLETSNGSLSGDDNGELSPLCLNDDVFDSSHQGFATTHGSANPLSVDENLPIKSGTIASQEEPRKEINKRGQDEKLEMRDTFDAYAVGKSKTRHLSTVKRRKFSFVSTAVSAFVKNPSSDDLQRNARQSRIRSYSVTSQASIDSTGTSVDGCDTQRGRKSSKWQLENIICASSLARYAGRATRNEKGEISYTRPWRQKKKKVNKLEVNVFYAIARFMLQKQNDLRKAKDAQKSLLDTKAESVEISKSSVEANNSTVFEGAVKNTHVESLRKDKVSPTPPSATLSPRTDSEMCRDKAAAQCKRSDNAQPSRAVRKIQDRGSFSASSFNKRGSLNKEKTKSRDRVGSALASTPDPHDIPNLASIIDPSKTPINLTNGVLEYDDDLSTVASGLMIPGRKQVRYKGILLRNYVSPQDRYKIEPRMHHKKPTSIRWNAKEGAIVTAHTSTGGESASKTVNVVFPKQARQRALAKMVEDNHSQPVDNSARQANAELRAKIDQFLLSVEPYCLPKQKTALF